MEKLKQKGVHGVSNCVTSNFGKFARRAVLIGSLLLPMAPNYAQAEQPQKKESAAQEVTCNGPKGKLDVGQEFSFGVSWRAMHEIKITGLTKDNAIVDLTVPYKTSFVIAVVSVSLTYKGIEIPRSKLEPYAKLCEETANAQSVKLPVATEGDKQKTMGLPRVYGTEGRPKMVLPGNYGDKATPKTRVPTDGQPAGEKKPSKSGRGYEDAWDQNKSMKNPFEDMDPLKNSDVQTLGFSFPNITLGKGLLEKKTPANFEVIESEKDEMKLRVKSGPQKGKIYRLDRKIDLNIEFVSEEIGFLLVPYRIESLSVKKGQMHFTVKVDCTRDVYSEGILSKQSNKPHQSCKPAKSAPVPDLKQKMIKDTEIRSKPEKREDSIQMPRT